MNIFDIYFLDKYYLLLLIIIPLFLFIFYKQKKKLNNFKYLSDLKNVFWKNFYIFYIKVFLFCSILFLFIIILANPNIKSTNDKVTKNGIDIVFAFDVSYSMNANDLNPNRIESAKTILNDFLDYQSTNRLGLVVFSWKPFTSIPLTFDYDILKQTIGDLSTSVINQNVSWLSWTAVWDALLMSSNLFKNKDREKVIILLTDWEANVGIDPEIAAQKLKQENIKLYSIWIWSKEWWEIEINNWPFTQIAKINPLNDEYLKKLSSITNWKYYSATDNNSFKKAFEDLEKLEKNNIEVNKKVLFKPIYDYFVYLTILFLFIYILLVFYKNNID